MKFLSFLVFLAITGCTYNMDMTPGQLDRAVWDLRVANCVSRSRVLPNDSNQAKYERATYVYACSRSYE